MLRLNQNLACWDGQAVATFIKVLKDLFGIEIIIAGTEFYCFPDAMNVLVQYLRVCPAAALLRNTTKVFI
jgi:hypothetical protein